MTDPYKVLGVSRDSSDDEIKKAYRSLSRKYHPDANMNNPNKEKAEEMFKLVQQAYDQIIKEKESGFGSFGSFGGFGGAYGGQQSNTTENMDEDMIHLRAAVNYINSRHFQEAINVLNGISDRDSRWYYYSAMANAGQRNQATALEHAKRATDMEPHNIQYQTLYQQLQNGGNWYSGMGQTYGMPTMNGGNFCLKLFIANLICNICCGSSGMCCGGTPYR